MSDFNFFLNVVCILICAGIFFRIGWCVCGLWGKLAYAGLERLVDFIVALLRKRKP